MSDKDAVKIIIEKRNNKWIAFTDDRPDRIGTGYMPETALQDLRRLISLESAHR